MNKSRRLLLIIGKTGYGKSYLSRSLFASVDRVVVLDTMSEYGSHSDGDFAGVVFEDFFSFQEYAAEHWEDSSLRLICRMPDLPSYEAVMQVCDIGGNVWIVIEEMANFSSPHYLSPIIENIVRFGRHRSISLCGITQRVSDIHPLVRNNVDCIVAFNCGGYRDIQALRNTPFIAPEEAESVGLLPAYQHKVFWNI